MSTENTSPQAKQDLSNKLLDLALATDLIVSLKDNQGIKQLIAVDVTTNPHKEQSKLNTIRGKREDGDPKGLNRNQNLPLVRRALGFQKHSVLVINHQNPPSYEALLAQLYAFAHQDRKTDSINLYDSQSLAPGQLQKGTSEPHPKEKEAAAIAFSVRSMLSDLKLGQRQPDGSLAFASRQYKYWQNRDIVGINAKDGRGEIFKVKGFTLETWKLSVDDLATCQKLTHQIADKLSRTNDSPSKNLSFQGFTR